MSSKSKPAVLVGAAILLVLAFKFLPVQALLSSALDRIAGLGPWGPVLFVVIYILACVLFIPGSLLTLGAGALFGVAKGAVCVSVGATLGAAAAFLVGRYLARDWVSQKIEGNAKFKAVDEAVAREGWKIVGLVRLSPLFPFNLINYAFGLTRVRLREYFFASWIGMLPGTVMYVYIGSLAGDLASLGATGRTRSPAEWALTTVGVTATVAVTLFVTRIAKKSLDKKIS